jgi:hypothetical protein
VSGAPGVKAVRRFLGDGRGPDEHPLRERMGTVGPGGIPLFSLSFLQCDLSACSVPGVVLGPITLYNRPKGLCPYGVCNLFGSERHRKYMAIP